jgi:hypothetical protein
MTLNDVRRASEIRPLPLAEVVAIQVAAWLTMVGHGWRSVAC